MDGWLVALGALVLLIVALALGALARERRKHSPRPIQAARKKRKPHLALKGQPLSGELYVDSERCMACEVPARLAPQLFAESAGSCVLKRQPATVRELRAALRVLHEQALGCVRYRGHDPRVLDLLSRLGCSAHCDDA